MLVPALGARIATNLPVGTLVVPRAALFATALLVPLVLVPAGAASVAFVVEMFLLEPCSRGTIFICTPKLQTPLRGVKGVGGLFGNHHRRQWGHHQRQRGYPRGYPHFHSPRCPKIRRRGVRNRGCGDGGPVQRQRPNESEVDKYHGGRVTFLCTCYVYFLGVRWRCLLLKKRFTVGVGLVCWCWLMLPAKSETNKNPTDSTIFTSSYHPQSHTIILILQTRATPIVQTFNCNSY